MDFLRYFKNTFEDPYLVAKIQKCFGVSYQSNCTLKVDSKEAQSSEETTTFQRKKSLSHSSSYPEIKEHFQPNETTSFRDGVQKLETNCESADSKNLKNYAVKNKFWYFLFLFGTYLGDEVGYAVCIPFLVWNFDPVVGRRAVLVWTIIMYTGEEFVLASLSISELLVSLSLDK